MYPWGLESSLSVHGVERGMLRITSPGLRAELLPRLTGTSAPNELPAVQPATCPVQPSCLRTVYWAEPVYPFALTYPFVDLHYIYSSTSS